MQKQVSRRDFLKKSAKAALGAGLLGTSSTIIVGCTRKEFDLILRGGLVYDGLGSPPDLTDVGIRDFRIAAIGDLKDRTFRRIVDAAGRAVSPGFIDVHSHTDIGLLVNPNAESKIRQGVTTEVTGQCGDSPFPYSTTMYERVRENARKNFKVNIDWTDADGFLNRLEKNGSSVNYVTFVGHGTIRAAVMGYENRDPSADELQRMRTMLREAIEQGAFGMSTGLEYTPGSFAKTEEVVALCHDVADMDGVYSTHMRSEDVYVEEALEETLRIARETDVSLQISHLKASQKRNWSKLPRMLDHLIDAEKEGIRVNADRYTYTAWSTTLKVLFPMWTREGEKEAFVERLEDDAKWKEIRPFVADKVNALGSWDSVLLTHIRSDERKHFQGKTVAQITEDLDEDPYDFVRDLLIAEEGDVGMCGFGMSDENTDRVLAFPQTMVGSDGTAVAPYGKLSRGNPHPRHYGAFPRYLGHYVREKKLLSLVEAIRRSTSMAAKKIGIKDRGTIEEGKFADIVIFDPETVIDRATFTNPHQYPEGIDTVIVNGRLVIHDGEHTGKAPGHILRKS
jgi:N-acyl-D-amino-acid deacylase